MATRALDRSTLEEKLIWFGIVMTWPVYAIGGLYVLGAVLGWLVIGLCLLRLAVEGVGAYNRVPTLVWVWVVAMLMMEVALLVGHIDWSLGLGKTIKSSIGWAKGWALIALFILLGSMLRFNVALLSRACCIVAAQAIIFFIISLSVYIVGGPETLFVSPMRVFGPGPEYFELRFFGINPETQLPRWFFFAPWAPATGLMSCLMLLICLSEEDRRWRFIGVAGCVLMVLLCQSRAGLAIFILIVPMVYFLGRLRVPWVILLMATALPLLFLLGYPLIEYVLDSYQQIRDSRPGSTRVRSALANIAMQRWWHEAPIWGHGTVERGPKIVEHMPIGTHHSWYGLLFTKGIVGAASLAIPMLMTVVYLLVEAQRSAQAATGFGLIMVLVLYSFFENLEILAYLYWPALLWIGYTLNPVNTYGEEGVRGSSFVLASDGGGLR